MLWGNRLPRLSGVILILLCVCIVISTAVSNMSGNDPFTRGDVKGFLQDIDDSRTQGIISIIFGIVVDSILGILAAVVLYTLLRDRGRVLATAALVLIVAAAGVFMVSDAVNAILINVARDFTRGGPPGVSAGDAGTLEVGRALGMAQLATMQIGWDALSAGVLLFGAIVARAPAGAVNPPRWLGIIGVIAGLAGFLSWFGIIADPAFVLFIISAIGQVIFLAGTGIWLIARPEEQAAQMRTAPA